MALADDVREAERRVEARRVVLHARVATLRASWRERLNPRALVLAGVAVGFALEQLLAYRSRKPIVYEAAPDEPPRKKSTHRVRKAAHALHLLPLAQLALTKWLAQRRPDDDQSPRSINLADHSVSRKGNGLARH